MSLEKIGRMTLKNFIVKYLDSTHSATLSEIVGHLPEEIRGLLSAEDRDKVIMGIVDEMIRNNELALMRLKG
jgi:hypothetical protein